MDKIQEKEARTEKNKPEAEAPGTPPPEAPHPDPTRYGDWEIKGKCVDF